MRIPSTKRGKYFGTRNTVAIMSMSSEPIRSDRAIRQGLGLD